MLQKQMNLQDYCCNFYFSKLFTFVRCKSIFVCMLSCSIDEMLCQQRRLCGGSRARAPSEIILWGPNPHRNVSYLSNNVHIYMYTHTHMCLYIMIIAIRAPPEIFQSRRLCVTLSSSHWKLFHNLRKVCDLSFFLLKK